MLFRTNIYTSVTKQKFIVLQIFSKTIVNTKECLAEIQWDNCSSFSFYKPSIMLFTTLYNGFRLEGFYWNRTDIYKLVGDLQRLFCGDYLDLCFTTKWDNGYWTILIGWIKNNDSRLNLIVFAVFTISSVEVTQRLQNITNKNKILKIKSTKKSKIKIFL